jgi:hypothetical protein
MRSTTAAQRSVTRQRCSENDNNSNKIITDKQPLAPPRTPNHQQQQKNQKFNIDQHRSHEKKKTNNINIPSMFPALFQT